MIAPAGIAQRNTVEILGVPVDRITMADALLRVQDFIASGTPHLIVTADASGLAAAQSDAEHLEILKTADLATPDSVGVLWAGKRTGVPFPERVSGVDLAERIIRLSADKGYRVFLLGAAPGVAEMAAERLRLKHPGCNIVGARHGFFPSDSDELVATEVAQSKPDVLLVAMGIPRQEKFIKRTQHIIGAPVSIGVGGSFDVFSGKVKRAPVIIQKLKLEWVWRLLLNPKKIGKVMFLPKFVRMVLKNRSARAS